MPSSSWIDQIFDVIFEITLKRAIFEKNFRARRFAYLKRKSNETTQLSDGALSARKKIFFGPFQPPRGAIVHAKDKQEELWKRGW